MSVGDDGLNQDLVDQGAINQIVGKFSDHPTEYSRFSVSGHGGGGGGGGGRKTRVLVDNFEKNR